MPTDFLKHTDVRKQFLNFFASKHHFITPKLSLIPNNDPYNDPSLFFVNAGMNHFKDIFLGKKDSYQIGGFAFKRVANSQHCLRVSGKHNDLEDVGYDGYHHTLFEMLGNWSFGDYYKKQAIQWAWEFLTGNCKIPKNRIYVTYFSGNKIEQLTPDYETKEYWEKYTDINPNHILPFGKKENFWEMGQTGPCGPCSEIHIDIRDDNTRKYNDGKYLVNKEHKQVIEIWNLVFICYQRDENQKLSDLPNKHIDTGMGLERICMVLQQKDNTYDTDIFTPLLQKMSLLSGKNYGENIDIDIAFRVNVDHIRAIFYALSYGVIPSNEGKGYIIRRILRRALRLAWDRLNAKEPYLYRLVSVLESNSIETQNKEQSLSSIALTIKAEEESFFQTLGSGLKRLKQLIYSQQDISGKDAFTLYDTYGFPLDLTIQIAQENNIIVDQQGFYQAMNEKKTRSRIAQKQQLSTGESVWIHLPPTSILQKTQFIGYNQLSYNGAEVVTSYSSGKPIIEDAYIGEKLALVLDKTCFYPEGGGQIADAGTIYFNKCHLTCQVELVIRNGEDIVHFLDIREHGILTENINTALSGTCNIEVDPIHRAEVSKHHSATHLLHAALRQRLGTHITQKGSYVGKNYLRFDFNHYKPLTKNELDDIHHIVNDKIAADIGMIEQQDYPIEKAKKEGATMLFGEKYDQKVRTIAFEKSFSYELCGGTHVSRSSQLGIFTILQEESVAAGIRRITATTGRSATQFLLNTHKSLIQIQSYLNHTDSPEKQVQELQLKYKTLETKYRDLEQQFEYNRAKQIVEQQQKLSVNANWNTSIIATKQMQNNKQLKKLGQALMNIYNQKMVILLYSITCDKQITMWLGITKDLCISHQLHAGKIIQKLTPFINGKGGGQSHIATAGGTSTTQLNKIESYLRQLSTI